MTHIAHRFSTTAGLVVVAAVAAGSALTWGAGAPGQTSAQLQRPAACVEPLPSLYARISPTVVSISAISVNPYATDHRIERVSGSGVIIDPSGLVLSNSHVVFGRQVITVTLDDGSVLTAKLVGADPIFDVALLKVSAPAGTSLPVAKLGNSDELPVGEEVYAIGNPLGLDQTLTRGIVSAINRSLPGAAWSLTEPLIQTDAAINPGNSGGPLVDPCGNVVGITTAMLPDAQNIGFAVPSNVVKDVIPELLELGHVVRPWLGVQGQFVAQGLKDLLRLPLVDGFLVESVEPGSPAEQQGLQGGVFEITLQGQPVLLGGDIITHVNGVPINDSGKLMQTLGSLKVGSTLSITAVKDGKSRIVKTTLAERPVLLWDVPARRTWAALASTAGNARHGTIAQGRTIIF